MASKREDARRDRRWMRYIDQTSPTAGVEAMCEVLADYVVRERDRGEQPAPAEVKKVLLPVEDEGLDEERPEIDEVTVVYAKDDPADPERRKT